MLLIRNYERTVMIGLSHDQATLLLELDQRIVALREAMTRLTGNP